MVRDGRATVNSIITRKVTITGFDLKDYRKSIEKWNKMIKGMFVQCELLGKERCLKVNYEKLVLEPKETMVKILDFLELPWNENVLHHEDFINKTHGIALSQ
jgi:protein-tyrosine sulfotransferase